MEKRYLLTALTKDSSIMSDILAHLEHVDAKIEKKEDLGPRKLFYPIAKNAELTVLSVYAQIESDKIKALEEELRHEEKIVRYLLTTWKVDPNAPVRSRAKKETKAEDVQS